MKAILIPALLLLFAAPTIAADDTLCVAVLPPDAPKADEFPPERNPAPWLDTLMTADLARRGGLVAVDRSLLDRVLAERKLELAGLSDAQGRALQGFRAAGVLVVSAITPAKDAPGRKAGIAIEAVIAQTGQLVGDLRVVAEWSDGQWRMPADWQARLDAFWADVRRQVGRNTRSVLVEVTTGKLTSPLKRLEWMLDELNDNVRTRVSLLDGAVVLVPRHPLSTSEERLLRVMGLSAPGGDKAAALAPAPDLRFDVELIEQVAEGIEHDRTPIRIKLTCEHNGDKTASPEFEATFGTWEKARDATLKWVAAQVAKVTRQPTAGALDEERAAALAKEEVAEAQRRSGDRRLYHAMRAAHLDPTNETAAWMIVTGLRDAISAEGRRTALASKDRVIQMSLRYLERFPKAPAEHRKDAHRQIGIAAYQAINIVDTRMKNHVFYVGFLPPPAPQVYPYGRIDAEHSLLASLAGDPGTGDRNAYSATMTLRLDVIANCPREMLDEEYKFWRKFWTDRVESQRNRDLPPWDLIEVAFAARRRDVKATRAAMTRLATVYPRSHFIWNLFAKPIVPMYLRAADDPNWETWQPDFGSTGEITVTSAERKRLWDALERPVLDVWDYEKAPAMDAVRLRLPADFLLYAQSGCWIPYPHAQAIASAEGDLWLVSPSLWDPPNARKPNRLAVTPIEPLLKADAQEAVAPLTPVKWPELPPESRESGPLVLCAHVTREGEHETVWIGTASHGLARFDKRDGRWVGRWYTTRDGLPMPCVFAIGSTRAVGSLKLVVQCVGQNPMLAPDWVSNIPRVLVLLDVGTNKFRILSEKGGQVATWPDRDRVPLSLLCEEPYSRQSSPELREAALQTMAVIKGTFGAGVNLDSRNATIISNGDYQDHPPPDIPLTQIQPCVGVRDTLWMICRGVAEQGPDRGSWLLLYRPAKPGTPDWAAADRWIGPFSAPDKEPFTALLRDGDERVWVTTTNGVHLVRVDRLLAEAEKAHLGMSTRQWREDYASRLERADWRVRVKTFVIAGK